MASMYDEYERAVDGGRTKRSSPWGVVLGAVLGLFLLGGAAVVALGLYALNTAQDVVVDVMADFDETGGPLVIELPSDRGEPTVIELDNLEELRNLKHRLRHELRHELRDVKRAEVRRAIRAGQAGHRTVDVSHITNEVLKATEEALRDVEGSMRDLDPALQDVEGELTFSIDGESVKMEVFADDEAGTFLMEIGDRSYSVRLDGEDDGARLLFTTPEGESVLLAGAMAESAPAWVPLYPGSSHPDRVFSGEVAGKTGGAGLSMTEDSPLDVVGHFTEALEGEGFDVSIERLSLGRSDVQGSIVGTRESDGRTVAVVVAEDAGQTKILTFWGETP